MKKSVLLAWLGLAAIVAFPANAATSSFDFTQCTTSSNYAGQSQTESGSCGADNYSNTSNSFSQTVAGVTVTATAYATAAGTTKSSGGVGDTLTSANSNGEVGQYTGYGIGVCSAGEAGAPDSNGYSSSDPQGCNSPFHQVNNDGDYEFILFTFSTPVSLNSIVLANFGGGSTIDMDMSYWTNPSSLTTVPAAATNVFCGDSGEGAADQNATCPTVEGSGSGIGTGSMTDTLSGTNVTTLLVGAYVGATGSPADTNPDFFKIQELNITKIATPEPATFGLIGFALSGLGLIARKRKQK
jgi:hypothetical protein